MPNIIRNVNFLNEIESNNSWIFSDSYIVKMCFEYLDSDSFYHFFKNNTLTAADLAYCFDNIKEADVYVTGLQKLSLNFIKERESKIDFSILSKNPFFFNMLEINMDIDTTWLEKIDWEYISNNYSLSLKFLTKYYNYLIDYRHVISNNLQIEKNVLQKWEEIINSKNEEND